MRKFVALIVLALFTVSASALAGNRRPQSERAEARKERKAKRGKVRNKRQARREERRDDRLARRTERRKTRPTRHEPHAQGIAVGEPNPATPVQPAPDQAAPGQLPPNGQ